MNTTLSNRRIRRVSRSKLPEDLEIKIRKYYMNFLIIQLKTLTQFGTDNNPVWIWSKNVDGNLEYPGWQSLNGVFENFEKKEKTIRKDKSLTMAQLKTLTRHGTDEKPQWTWLNVNKLYPECPGWQSLGDKSWKLANKMRKYK